MISGYLNSTCECTITPDKASKNHTQLYELTNVTTSQTPRNIIPRSAQRSISRVSLETRKRRLPILQEQVFVHPHLSHETFYFISETCSLSVSLPFSPHSSYLYSHLFIPKLLPDSRIDNPCGPELQMPSSLFFP